MHLSYSLRFNSKSIFLDHHLIKEVRRIKALLVVIRFYFSTLNSFSVVADRLNALRLLSLSRIWSSILSVILISFFVGDVCRAEIIFIISTVRCSVRYSLYRIWIVDAQVNSTKFTTIHNIMTSRQSGLASFLRYLFAVEDLMLRIYQGFNLVLPCVMNVLGSSD